MKRTLALDLQPNEDGQKPLFQRLAEAIAGQIRRGTLQPGERLPSSRVLARELGVHRNTVLAALRELDLQGYIASEPARGTFVNREFRSAPRPRAPRRDPEPPAPVRFTLGEAPPARLPELPPGVLALVGGLPDMRQVPWTEYARAHRQALRSPSVLDYGSEYGDPRLLEALAEQLRTGRGVLAQTDELLITRGSQQALYLAAATLAGGGGTIAVEAHGYAPAWEAFRLAGARLVPVPVDGEGLVVSELERLTESTDVAAVYTTPHHQYPTTVTQSGPRRQALLRLAARRRICILEDDYHHEYHFAGRPVWPLASDDARRLVLHIGTFSKVLAPGLRIGYAVGQAEIIRRMAARRAYTDRQGDLASERALASMITGGELGGHVRRMHRIYRERRACLASALERELGDELQFEIPAGGLGLWVTARRGIDTDAWAEAALARGVLVHSARRFRFDGRKGPELRLGFARHDEPELEEAVRRLRLALRDVTRRP